VNAPQIVCGQVAMILLYFGRLGFDQ